MTKTRKVVASGLVALLTGATLAACGDAPEEENGGSGSQAAASDFLPCIVSDAGGFDDKSFNQLGFEGAKQAADDDKEDEGRRDGDHQPASPRSHTPAL